MIQYLAMNKFFATARRMFIPIDPVRASREPLGREAFSTFSVQSLASSTAQ